MSAKQSDYPQQVSAVETATILELLESTITANVPGDVVEFGCYKGDTSILLQKLLHSTGTTAEAKTLWLYDSFEGLPPKTVEDASVAGDSFKAGELFVTKREVVAKFKKAGLRVPRIKKAFFEDLLDQDLPPQISFAFLDGDLYGSIKTSLALVTPRLTPGAIIVVHDYNNPELPGSAKAVDEYLRNHPTKKLAQKATLAIIR
ncbi:class I SAM-dependent methyltransferase [Candidatus Saccharibacteria bacterium]|nr:class I SAM-dependent methyltransferase [Candidatus Saccharibacteria bacterium]